MRKGFNFFKERNDLENLSLKDGFQKLGDILLNEIGGSMGPLYGLFFTNMGESLEESGDISPKSIYEAMNRGYEEIVSIGSAKVGDKTLIDVLNPALTAFKKAIDEGKSSKECFDILSKSAVEGKESTKDMEAKIGRASRLGKRSIGIYDPGATSCALIVETLSNGLKELV